MKQRMSAVGPSLHFSTFSIYVGFWGKPEVRRQFWPADHCEI
jgi:hypothetical protein